MRQHEKKPRKAHHDNSLAGYPRAYAQCRELGHSWDVVQWHGLERVLYCEHCTTLRKEEFGGADLKTVASRAYRYPKDYLISAHTDQAEVGIEVWRRISRLAVGQNLRVAAEAKRLLREAM